MMPFLTAAGGGGGGGGLVKLKSTRTYRAAVGDSEGRAQRKTFLII
jgi:hypothetical protein